MKPLLFLTDAPFTVSAIENIARNKKREIDYFLHSTEKENAHQFDLRNTEKINSLTNEATTFVFYLHGNLAVYVIENFLRSVNNRNMKIYVILSAINDFFLRPNKETRATKSIEALLNEKACDHTEIKIFLTEDIYENHLRKYEPKGKHPAVSFKDLVVPIEAALAAVVNLSEKKELKETTVFFINEKVTGKFQDYSEFLRIKTSGISLLEFVGKIFPTDAPLFEHANVISAITKFLEDTPLQQNIFPLPVSRLSTHTPDSFESVNKYLFKI